MRAGKLNKRIQFQENQPIRNEMGEKVPTWVTVYTVWASIKAIGGQERFSNNKESAEVSHRIKVRYRTGLSPAMQIRFGSRVFDIQHIQNHEERNRDITIMALEQVP